MPDGLESRGFTCVRDAVADARIREALPAIAAAVTELALPGFAGLVMGGGYGRGEGGARSDHSLYNDMDFFVLLDAPESAFPELAKRLEPVSSAFARRLGLDVDFTLRTAARIRLDERRLMVQELLRGHVPLAPAGFDLLAWSGARLYPAAEVPVEEAARLLMNRGMGLLLATDPAAELPFVIRNINKAVLGAGDARLVAERRYAWTLAEREAALGDAAYAKACAFKRRPADDPAAVATWEEAAAIWREAYAALFAQRGDELHARSLYQALRWVRRRKTLGNPVWTLGMDCTVRVLERLAGVLATARRGVRTQDAVMRDWEVFN